MNRHIKFSIFSLLIIFSLICVKSADAVVLNDIQIRETENIKVITTVSPTPVTKITIKPIKNIELRTTLKKTNAQKEINRRLENLNKLITKINNISKISSSQKEKLLTQVTTEINKLEELKTKIEAETDATALQEEKKSITESYRIYALFIPKIEIIAHADKIITIAEAMSGKTTDEALLAKISDSRAVAQSSIDLVMPLMPEQYPGFKTTLKTARDLLKTARTNLNQVYSALKAEE